VAAGFFGTLRVTRGGDGVIRLWHGTTQHGSQFADDRDHPAPLAYYHRKGPLGRLFAGGAAAKWHRVGVVGLGSGAMAAYAEPHQKWTFYEIDPAVVRVARDERFFTYLSTGRAASLDVVLGDARRQLAREPDGTFDLLVLDAFSSDAIPVHLLTAEAFAQYRAKLRPGGVLAFHLSNRYLDLPPLVARLAADADPTLVVRMDEDGAVSDTEAAAGKLPATWVFVAGRVEDLGAKRLGQVPITPLNGRGWTDDFSNVLGVWRRREE
jgi:SAM-dependent methyltransferase